MIRAVIVAVSDEQDCDRLLAGDGSATYLPGDRDLIATVRVPLPSDEEADELRAMLACDVTLAQPADQPGQHGTARVVLFKPSGKYYTEERWPIPDGALSPSDMARSSGFRRIDGGAVLIDAQEPWGYPHLFPSAP